MCRFVNSYVDFDFVTMSATISVCGRGVQISTLILLHFLLDHVSQKDKLVNHTGL
jgi:hypothetical protein